MCGRYMLTLSNAMIERHFGVPLPKKYAPNYNAAPSQLLPVILQESPREAVFARWGLIPHWAKDVKIGYKMINARAETLLEKPAYRGLLSSKRCLVIADGFYEWKKGEDGKQPFRIMRKDGGVFAFAGLYDKWLSPQGEVVSYTIITGEPNSVEAKVHDRAPVILAQKDEKAWLSLDKEHALKLLKMFPAAETRAYPVSTAVNSPAVNNADLLAEIRV